MNSYDHPHGVRPLTEIGDGLALALIESSPDGVIVTDEQGSIRLVNEMVEKMFGFDRAELLGRGVEDLMPERFRGRHRADRTRYRAEPWHRHLGSDLDLRARHRDGHEFPVEISLNPLLADESLMVVTTIRDVSDRVALQSHARLVQSTIDAAHDGFFMFCPDTLHFTYVNQGACKQLGYSEEELLAMTPLHIKPQFTIESFREMLEALLTGEADSLIFTTVHRTKTGEDRPVEVLLEFPRQTVPEQPRVLIAVVRDISERLEAEAERQRQEAWLDALSEIRSWLFSQGSTERILELICHHARLLANGDDALILSPSRQEPRAIVLAADGERRDRVRQVAIPLADTALGDALDNPDPPDLTDPASPLVQELAAVLAPYGLGRFIGAPLRGMHGQTIGLLLVAQCRPDSDGFRPEDQQLVTNLAFEANTAIGAARVRVNVNQMTALEDQIGKADDLHQVVIQQLIATGCDLQGVAAEVPDPDLGTRLERAVLALDQTIIDIQAAAARSASLEADGVVGRVEAVISGAVPVLGFRPELRIEGEVEAIPDPIVDQLIPVLTEGLSNVARHAGATSVDIDLTESEGGLRLEMSDDGLGFDDTDPDLLGRGLRRVARRARRFGGTFDIALNESGGTTLSWAVRGRNP